MKKAKENWIGEQCSEIEENLRKNNSKRAYQLVKDDHCETGESDYCSELYNRKANGDPSVLNCPQTHTQDDHPILCKEMEAAYNN